MEKADSLSGLIRKLESQVANIGTAIKRETGRLPGRTDLKPRRQVSAVMLRSGKHLATNTKINTEIGNSANADETGKSNSQPILLDDPDPKPFRENGKSDIAQIEDEALSDMKNQLEEETSYSDPYPVFNIDSFTQAYDIAVKSRT
ncbi:hypothetical protein DY000_02023834 [Brassica cretica]|uniref:Uncharacterized protein n=1 Tax=Brassica cretica TaxID=69181 RepID=A0ABQ7E4U4_BRACR|nr:hypothetical protein DY000_02023834 [Brassica cretica]